jgi:hypothetical protein
VQLLEHRSIAASQHRSIAASQHRSIAASQHRSIAIVCDDGQNDPLIVGCKGVMILDKGGEMLARLVNDLLIAPGA